MSTYYRVEKKGNFFEIIVPDHPEFNTTCNSREEAELLCRVIDEIIMRIEQLNLWEEMEQERLKELNFHIKKLKEQYERNMKQLEEIMKKFNEWLDSFLNELQENLRVPMR